MMIDSTDKALARQQSSTALDVLLYSLSETSRRQYQHTYQQWSIFCRDNGIDAKDMRPQHLIGFLEQSRPDGKPYSHSTKKNRLTHMRKLLETLCAQQPENVALDAMYKQAQLIKVKRSSDEQPEKRERIALKPQQVFNAFTIFAENTKLHTRNRALLAILFYGGLRRAEAVALRWDDIDFDEELVTVQHGKGDKARTIPLLGGIDYLREWRAMVPGREFVFCGVRKGDHLGDDKPISTQSVWLVMKVIAAALDIEGLSPHDARRTIITEMLRRGVSVPDAQFIAGHANPQTTLGYAVEKNARDVRGRVRGKIGY